MVVQVHWDSECGSERTAANLERAWVLLGRQHSCPLICITEERRGDDSGLD